MTATEGDRLATEGMAQAEAAADPREEWRPVVGYEGRYEVSSLGRLRSLDRISVRKNGYRVPLKGRLLTGYVTRYGYRRVSLGKNTHVQLHRLILEAFAGPAPDDKPEGCHRDGNPLNNRVDNLYWGDRVDNMRDMVAHGRHPASNKTHCKNGHPFDEVNTRVREGRAGRGRRCITCRRAAQARYDAKRRNREVAA